jgi:hypothetical protein
MKCFFNANIVQEEYMIWNDMIRPPEHALVFSASKNASIILQEWP